VKKLKGQTISKPLVREIESPSRGTFLWKDVKRGKNVEKKHGVSLISFENKGWELTV